MSRHSFCKISALLVAMVVGALAVAPDPTFAEDRPFKARLAGNASLSPTEDPLIVRNDETGKGNATHLGRFTWKSVEFVTFVPGGVEVVGTFTMTAANGDLLLGTYETTGFVNMDGNLIIHGSYEFAGGTGRFVDAAGSGDIDAEASLAEGLPFTGTLRGTIEY
jgi:hypothetical protein